MTIQNDEGAASSKMLWGAWPRYVALGAFVSTLPAYTPALAAFERAPQYAALADPFLLAFMIATLLVSVIAIARLLREGDGLKPAPRASMASLLYLASLLVFVGLLMAPVPVIPGAACAGIVAGAFLPRVLSAWADAASLPLASGLLLCAVVGGVASFVGWLLATLPLFALVAVFCVLAVVGVLPLARAKASREGVCSPCELDLETAETGTSAHHRLGRLASVISLPLMGLVAYTFMTDLAVHSASDVVWASYLGGPLAAITVLAATAWWARRPLLPWCYRVLVPTMAALFVVLGSFPAGTVPQQVSLVALCGFYTVLAILGCALVLAVVHARELPSSLVCSFAAAAVSAVTLLAQAFSPMLAATTDASLWMPVVTGLFMAALLLFLGRTAWTELVTPQDEEVASEAKGMSAPAGEQAAQTLDREPSVRITLEARCAEVAAAHGLSPREAEVLVYLARGFTPAYIAKSLVLSISTVRTHVRNIYRKLGIGKREELLHLIDGE